METLAGRARDVQVVTKRRQEIKRTIFLSIACILLVAVILAAVIYFYVNHQYSSYEVKNTIALKKSSGMKCSAYQNGVLRYSRDGAAAVDRDGNEMWNGSYDMENPALDICEKYAVVADIQGKSLYVYNGSDSGTKLTTDYPILQACVSKQGVVAVLLEDQSSNVIQVYNPYDDNKKLLVEIPTNVEEGYPVSIDLSPDGTGVICASICVTSGAVKSQVAFYDFTDVGKNTNCLVGAQEYKDRIVAEVKYLDEDHAALFSEKGFSLWKNMKKPKQVFKKDWNREILSAFYNNRSTLQMLHLHKKRLFLLFRISLPRIRSCSFLQIVLPEYDEPACPLYCSTYQRQDPSQALLHRRNIYVCPRITCPTVHPQGLLSRDQVPPLCSHIKTSRLLPL